MNYKPLFFFICLLVLLSCEVFESHPYDGSVRGETNVNAKNIALIQEACRTKTTLRFAFISDTQYWFDEAREFVKSVNKRNDIDFVIHGGDMVEYSLTKEFMWIRDLMNDLNMPYIALLGNHDCLATGIDVFRRVFGPENYSFYAGDTKFVCLNTNALEFDHSEKVPDMDFMDKLVNDTRSGYERTVVIMHAPPFSEQFDGSRVFDFQEIVNRYKGVQFCMHGHTHSLTVNDFFKDGIIYYGVSSINKRKYLLFTLRPDNGYEYEVVTF